MIPLRSKSRLPRPFEFACFLYLTFAPNAKAIIYAQIDLKAQGLSIGSTLASSSSGVSITIAIPPHNGVIDIPFTAGGTLNPSPVTGSLPITDIQASFGGSPQVFSPLLTGYPGESVTTSGTLQQSTAPIVVLLAANPTSGSQGVVPRQYYLRSFFLGCRTVLRARRRSPIHPRASRANLSETSLAVHFS